MGNPWDGAACMELDRFLAARGIRFTPPTLGTTIGNPPGQGHTAMSNHYPEVWNGKRVGPAGSTGQARDYGTYGSDCNAIAEAFEPFARGRNYIISELIWTRRLPRTGIYYKRGIAYTPSLKLAWQHRDHDHVAIAVGRHLPGVEVPRPQPAPPPKPAPKPKPKPQEDEMKGRIIQCRKDGPNSSPAKHEEGWFFAICDPTPVKWHIPPGPLTDHLFMFGHVSNQVPTQVGDDIFDSYKTVG